MERSIQDWYETGFLAGLEDCDHSGDFYPSVEEEEPEIQFPSLEAENAYNEGWEAALNRHKEKE